MLVVSNRACAGKLGGDERRERESEVWGEGERRGRRLSGLRATRRDSPAGRLWRRGFRTNNATNTHPSQVFLHIARDDASVLCRRWLVVCLSLFHLRAAEGTTDRRSARAGASTPPPAARVPPPRPLFRRLGRSRRRRGTLDKVRLGAGRELAGVGPGCGSGFEGGKRGVRW